MFYELSFACILLIYGGITLCRGQVCTLSLKIIDRYGDTKSVLDSNDTLVFTCKGEGVDKISFGEIRQTAEVIEGTLGTWERSVADVLSSSKEFGYSCYCGDDEEQSDGPVKIKYRTCDRQECDDCEQDSCFVSNTGKSCIVNPAIPCEYTLRLVMDFEQQTETRNHAVCIQKANGEIDAMDSVCEGLFKEATVLLEVTNDLTCGIVAPLFVSTVHANGQEHKFALGQSYFVINEPVTISFHKTACNSDLHCDIHRLNGHKERLYKHTRDNDESCSFHINIDGINSKESDKVMCMANYQNSDVRLYFYVQRIELKDDVNCTNNETEAVQCLWSVSGMQHKNATIDYQSRAIVCEASWSTSCKMAERLTIAPTTSVAIKTQSLTDHCWIVLFQKSSSIGAEVVAIVVGVIVGFILISLIIYSVYRKTKSGMGFTEVADSNSRSRRTNSASKPV